MTLQKNRARAEPGPVGINQATIREDGRVQVMGRDGKPVSRKRGSNSDPFHVPPELIPDGWDYQWCRKSVLGEDDISQQIADAENGWAPVPADRHPGLYMPAGHKGPIIRDGLMLCERPMELTEEARAEEREKANGSIRGARERFGMSMRDKTQFETGTAGARAASFARSSYESIPADVPRPKHEVVVDE